MTAAATWRGQAARFAALALALSAPAAPATAQARLFTPPDGCATYLSVQSKGCRVSHHYICDGEAPGDQWRIDFDRRGPYFQSRINAETEWVQSFDLLSGLEIRLLPAPADPASFSALIAGGADHYDFSQVTSQGEIYRYVGGDRLTGRKRVIDGVSLEETEFEFTEFTAGGAVLGTARGHELIHREWRLFFAGPSVWEGQDGSERSDRSPVRFDQAGDPGFRSTEPEFDCDEQLAGRDERRPATSDARMILAALIPPGQRAPAKDVTGAISASLAANPEE